MVPQQLNTWGKVAFFKRANEEIHRPRPLLNIVLLEPCSQERLPVGLADEGALTSIVAGG
jgi:hypothetical protein